MTRMLLDNLEISPRRFQRNTKPHIFYVKGEWLVRLKKPEWHPHDFINYRAAIQFAIKLNRKRCPLCSNSA